MCTSTKTLRIALVQMAVGADKCSNLQEAVSQIKRAKDKGAEIVVLPECFNSPYGTNFFPEYAEELENGESFKTLECVARETRVCLVAGSIPERSNGKLYNTCTVWNPCGELIAKHRKIHLFDVDVPNQITFKESDALTPGNEVTTFEFKGIKFGVAICHDMRFYELSHLMAQQGCSILLYPSAFEVVLGPPHWELLNRARANDHQVYLAAISPARDVKADYVAYGHTLIVNPWGEVMEELDENPGVIITDIDLTMIDRVRKSIPLRRQRRTDLYDTIQRNKSCCY